MRVLTCLDCGLTSRDGEWPYNHKPDCPARGERYVPNFSAREVDACLPGTCAMTRPCDGACALSTVPPRPKIVPMPVREPDFAQQVSALACLEDALARARTSPDITHAVVLLVTESADGGFHIDQRCAGDQRMSDTLLYLSVAKNRVMRSIEGRE